MTRALLLLLAGLACACAEPPDAPAARGERCESDRDCRDAGSTGTPGCGFHPLCVAGRCELSSSAPDIDRCDAGAASDRDE